MLKILREYQSRLINLSSRNMSLVLNKTYKKSSYDLASVDSIIPGYSNKIISNILNEKEKIEILPNPQKWFINELKICGTSSEKKDALDKKYKELMNLSKGLDYLFREIDFEKKETGVCNLYLGMYFIEGKFKDGSVCRAPLAMLSVDFIKEQGTWYIVNESKSDFEPNKVFLLSYVKQNKMKQETENEFTLESKADLKTQFIKFYKTFGIEIYDRNNQEPLCKMPNYTKVNYEEIKTEEFFLTNHLILGRFPTSNAIYEDYDEIINKKISTPLIKTLLNGEEKIEKSENSHFFMDESYNMDDNSDTISDLRESKHFYLSDLDYAQEETLTKINQSESLVCFGPPGTGKSQTLANVLSDSLAKGKKVLVVSQKRAALDVIYNRLSKINRKLALIHDAETGKKEFYGRIKEHIEFYEETYGNDFHYTNRVKSVSTNHQVTERNIKSIADKIENNISDFRRISVNIFKKHENGLSLQEMCHLTWKDNELTTEQVHMIEKFQHIQNKLPNLQYTYEKQVEFLELVLEENLVSTIKQNQELIAQTKLFLSVKEEPNFSEYMVLEDAYNKIKDILKDLDEHYVEGKYSRLYKFCLQDNDKSKLENKVESIMLNEYGYLLKPLYSGLKGTLLSIFKKKKIVEITEQRKCEYNQILEDYLQHAQKLLKIQKELEFFAAMFSTVFQDKFIAIFKKSLFENRKLFAWSEMQFLKEQYFAFLKITSRLNKFSKKEIQFVEKIESEIQEKELLEKILLNLPKLELYDFFKNKILYLPKTQELLTEIEQYEVKTKKTLNYMSQKSQNTANYINEFWDESFIQNAKADSNFSEFKRLAGFKRRFMPIRTYMDTFTNIIQHMYPCMLMGPETVSMILPLKKDLFDVIIFDEASQMYVEEAIPALFRAKKVIVAGDDMQLKPSGIFRKKFEEDEEYDKDSAAALEEESLLDLAKVTFPYTHLNFHYRSKYSELINFSNFAFYNGRLKLSPNVLSTEKMQPIVRVKVNSAIWDDLCNQKEAYEVVSVLKGLLEQRSEEETIGIITFNVGQKDLIYDLIEAEKEKDPVFRTSINKEQVRKDGDEDVSFFVKNIENVQGDERDIIIFSTGYAQNKNGKLTQHFGSLSQAGGENRLNVAITRAKKKVIVVTSFEPEELTVDNSRQIGPVRFKQYLEYVKLMNNKQFDEAMFLLKSIQHSNNKKIITNDFADPFSDEVFQELITAGYEVHKNVGASGYILDLAVFDSSLDCYVLGIECDGLTYYNCKSARERDIHRKKFLESRSWCLKRIWSFDWWLEKEKVLSELKMIIDREVEQKKKQLKQVKSLDFHSITVLETFEMESANISLEPNKISESKVKPKLKASIQTKENIVYEGNAITYGDRVVLMDSNGDTFEVALEKNKFNKQFMSEMELKLLGLNTNDEFAHKGYTYKIMSLLR